MAAENIIERAFSGGEIAPALYARVDQTRYQTGLRTARNFIGMRHGGVTQRPGSMFVGSTLNGANSVRLIPFIFNETGLGQSYMLEFGNQYIAFWQNGAPVQIQSGLVVPWSAIVNYNAGTYVSFNSITYYALQGGINHEPDISPTFWRAQTQLAIPSPYLQADLPTLNYAQSNDVVTITHHNYAPSDLTRNVAGVFIFWNLTPVTFDGTAPPVTLTGASGGVGSPPGTNVAYYVVTAIMANGDESLLFGGSNNNSLPTVAKPIVITWNVAAGAISYRVYKSDTNPLNINPFGFIGDTTSLTFSDPNIVADYSQSPPTSGALKALVAVGQNPANVAYIQQRRIFSNVPNNPIGAFASATGSITNFQITSPTTDSDAFSFTIAGDEVNAIQNILELKNVLMLTAGAELFIQGNGSGVVTPSAINASVQSFYGCSSLRPIKVGEVIIFNQALGNFIRDLVFDFSVDGYRGNDLTIFSAHLFEGHQIVDWAYQKIPDSILWAVRDDGVLLSCTYVREQQILCWTRHDFDNGVGGNINTPSAAVENVSCIPENGNYAVYLSIRRIINGSTVRYIERLSQRIWQSPAAAVLSGTAIALGDPIDATYLDCYSKFDGRNTTLMFMNLTVFGSFKTDTTAYQQQLTLTSSAPYFGVGQTAQVGDQIFLEDAQWVSSMGQNGLQLRLTIQSVSNSTTAIVTPDKAVAVEFQGTNIQSWARAVNQLSGLNYLAGQFVSIWADRYAIASSLRRDQVAYSVLVSNGQLEIPLPNHYSVIYVGLPMTADFETLAIDTSFGDSIMGERKNISRITVYLYNARGIFGGTQNPDTDPDNPYVGGVNDPLYNLTENKAQGNRQLYDSPPSLLTDWQYCNVDVNWSKEGRIFIRNVDPIPLSILAVIPAGLTSAKVAWSQKV